MRPCVRTEHRTIDRLSLSEAPSLPACGQGTSVPAMFWLGCFTAVSRNTKRPTSTAPVPRPPPLCQRPQPPSHGLHSCLRPTRPPTIVSANIPHSPRPSSRRKALVPPPPLGPVEQPRCTVEHVARYSAGTGITPPQPASFGRSEPVGGSAVLLGPVEAIHTATARVGRGLWLGGAPWNTERA